MNVVADVRTNFVYIFVRHVNAWSSVRIDVLLDITIKIAIILRGRMDGGGGKARCFIAINVE